MRGLAARDSGSTTLLASFLPRRNPLPGSEDKRDGAKAPSAGEPGPLSRLIRELADAPGEEVLEAWKSELQPGDRVGRFEIRREVGRGGFGAVHEAFDTELNRVVAVKALRLSRSRKELSSDWMKREAEAVARLDHPCIVTLFDVGTCPSGPYLVMELLRGKTLAQRLDDGPIPTGEALRISEEMARGLAHAHERGVLHRDLKPANVFLCDDGRVKLLDFGLAHLLGKPGEASGGTPAYMAPEQARGGEIDARADVFAAAVTLREMVTGRREPGVGASIPRALARVLDCGASPNREDRPRDGTAWRDEIREFQRSRARPRTVRRVAGLVLAGLLLGAAVAGMVLERRSAGRILGLASAPGERIPIAVADVVNETGEKELDVLSGLLVTSLEQSRRLTVMTQARVLDLASRAGRRDAVRVDETIGREVGKAHGIRALLLPAIRRLGTTYSLEMRVIDPERDEHLFTLSDRATSKEALLDLLDRLSERTRAGLGEGMDEVSRASVQLGESVTRSVEAYQHYLAGLEGWHRDGMRAIGLREFQEALRLDPGFAAAHGELAELLQHGYRQPDRAASHWRAANDLLQRMPEKERLLLRLKRAHRSPTLEHFSREEALRLGDEILARFPDDKFAVTSAAEAFESFELQARSEKALRRALELDPGYFWAADSLADQLAALPSDALSVARTAVAVRRNPANLSILAGAQWAAGDDAGAASTAREILRSEGGRNSLIAARACNTLYEMGAGDECIPLWTHMIEDGENDMERSYASFELMKSLAHQGRIRDALRIATTAPDLAGPAPPELLANIHQVGRSRLESPQAIAPARRISNPQLRRNFLSWLGAGDEAEQITTSLGGKGFEVVEKVNSAIDLVRRGQPAAAEPIVRAVRTEISRRWYSSSLFGIAAFHAEILLAVGRDADAAGIWPSPLPCRCTDQMDHAVQYPRLAIHRAHAMERLGRRADALRELDGVIAFWKEADSDLPLLVEAKSMRARLARSAVVDGVRP